MYVEKYAYIYLLKWASFLDPLHCNEQQKWWRVRPQLRYVKSSVTSFFEKKVTCSPLRWTFLHLKTILGMIAHKINLKMTHAGIFFILLFFPVFAMRDDDDGISSLGSESFGWYRCSRLLLHSGEFHDKIMNQILLHSWEFHEKSVTIWNIILIIMLLYIRILKQYKSCVHFITKHNQSSQQFAKRYY